MEVSSENQHDIMKKFTQLVFVVIANLIFLGFGSSENAFGQGWFDANWHYRKTHTINSATGAGTNYQVQVTVYYGNGTDNAGNVYCNTHCKTDFGDIRFTASDGSTLLDYWMQSYTASTSAVFW